MSFVFNVPSPHGPVGITLEAGTSAIFVGANGGGKTRLAVLIEQSSAPASHRISAHRALTLNPEVAKISEQMALTGLRYGNATHLSRDTFRWQNKYATSLLNDYDFLLQALFAEQANTSLITHTNARANTLGQVNSTKFEDLVEIWVDFFLTERCIFPETI
jgi:recombinational DNA repair ATPase RecF